MLKDKLTFIPDRRSRAATETKPSSICDCLPEGMHSNFEQLSIIWRGKGFAGPRPYQKPKIRGSKNGIFWRFACANMGGERCFLDRKINIRGFGTIHFGSG